MKKVYLLPYKMNSIGSKSISRFFGIKRIYRNGRYVPNNNHIVINWGVAEKPPVLLRNQNNPTIINDFNSVKIASNKMLTLEKLKEKEVPTLSFTVSKEEVRNKLNEGKKVYARKLLTGKAGKGIEIINPENEEIPDAPLYTEYFPNDCEYRVHIFNDEMIDAAQKKKMSKERARRMGIREEDRKDGVRNLKNGWSFVRKDINIPNKVKQVAIKGVNALDLDFGAVDIVYNSESDDARILEINTAPGMKKGTTTHYNYVKAFASKFGEEVTEDLYNRRYNCDILNIQDNDKVDEDE